MKRLSIFLMSAIVLSGILAGCSKTVYYQVYQTQPTNAESCQIKSDYLVYENSTCIVKHNFFSEEGNAGFWITNQTDSVMFLRLAESFFIYNGMTHDYYQSREWEETNSHTETASRQERKTKKRKSSESLLGSSSTVTKSTTNHEREVIMIPPHATRYISEYHLIENMRTLCGVKETPRKGKSAGSSFTPENSPLVFGNYITYTIGTTGKRVHVDNRFFVSEIINVHNASMFENVRTKDECGKEGAKAPKMLYTTPDRFYVKYKR